MPVQMIRGNPALERFAAETARATNERRAENEEFRQRHALERELAADKALRTGIANFYSQPQPAGAPPAAAAPARAAPIAAPAPVMPPAQRDNTQATMNGDIGGNAFPVPSAPPSQPAAAAPAVPAARPTVAAAPATRPSPLSGMIQELSKTSGTGATVMGLFNADQAQQRQQAKRQAEQAERGSRLMLDALSKNDVQGARLMAQQHGVEVPEEFWSNRQALSNLAIAGSTAKSLGVKGEHAVAFAQAFAAHLAKSPSDISGAVTAAQRAVPLNAFGGVKGRFVNDKNEVVFYDDAGNLKQTGQKGQQRKWEAAGGGGSAGRPSNTVQNRDNMASWIRKAYPGVDDQTVAKLIVNPKVMLTHSDALRLQSNLAKLTDAMGNKLYKTPAEIDAAAKELVAGARRMADDAMKRDPGDGTPAPAAPAPGARRPLSAFEAAGDDPDPED